MDGEVFMRIRKYVILLCFIAIVFYVNTGTGAWFTSSASSSGNTFKTGTLVISTTECVKPFKECVNLSNLQKGDSFVYTYTVVNTNEYQSPKPKNIVQSSLDLVYKNTIEDNSNDQNSLLNFCSYELTITDLNNKQIGQTSKYANFQSLKTALTKDETTLTGGTRNGRNYSIKILVTGNIGSCGSWLNQRTAYFKITSLAKQVNGQY